MRFEPRWLAHAHGDTDAVSDQHADQHTNCDTDSDQYADADQYADRHADTDQYADNTPHQRRCGTLLSSLPPAHVPARSGARCGVYQYDAGTVVTLGASSVLSQDSRCLFVSWSGDASGGGTSTTVVMDGTGL